MILFSKNNSSRVNLKIFFIFHFKILDVAGNAETRDTRVSNANSQSSVYDNVKVKF